MQNPAQDIVGVVKGLIEAKSADEQRDCMQRYFAPDASFDHPLCAVKSSANSRDSSLLPIYQWLRIISNSTIDVHSVGFDQNSNKLFIDATQRLEPTLWPLKYWAVPARLIVVLTLQRGGDGKFYIKRQEDWYEPQTMPAAFLPGGSWAVNTVKRVAGFNCALLAFGAQTVGIWKTHGAGYNAKKA